MKVERIKRYKDKINVILERGAHIREWVGESGAEEFIHDEKTKLAVYKAFQEIVESCMDILAMVCTDEKIVPKDDYTNIENLKFIDKRMKEVLIEANGLRNRLVHRYNQVDDLIAFVGIEELVPRLEEFMGIIDQWLQKLLKEG
ncbi:MAG: DUF86 domain-containing protein [Methanophagales archaeon ANME-1-THS]|nr:MAG: DUF86 domain-containing protein [Methanophagales archaeon ANME-1-THS]